MKNYDFQKSFVSFQKVFNDFFWNEGTKGKKEGKKNGFQDGD